MKRKANGKQKSNRKQTEMKMAGCAFFIVAAIFVTVCALQGVYPFGNQCILHIDMYHQYAPFFMDYMEKLKESGFSFYSWNQGLGSDMIATYAYYLASPMNLLLVFASENHLVEWMTVLVMIKMALCAATFSYYLTKHFKTTTWLVLLPSVFYALSGYLCAYYWNIMWLDCLWLFPLIVLGLEKLVIEKDFRLYAITLALSIWSNYYISIMICIFLVFYVFLLLAENRADEKNAGNAEIRTFLTFAGISVLSAGVSAVILFPEIKALLASGSGGSSFPEQMEWYFNVLYGVVRLCVLSEPSTTEGELPNLYCGVAVLFFMVLYACNRKISFKKKLTRLGFLVFLLFSFSNNFLDYIWHGLHFPDGLPAREAFLFVFVLLVICFEALLKKEGNQTKDLFFAGGFLAAVLILAAIKGEEAGVSTGAVLLSACYLVCYVILYLLSGVKERIFKRTAGILATVIVILESSWNFYADGMDTTSRDAYLKGSEDYLVLQECTEEKETGFYRTESFERNTKNAESLFGYEGASLFSSLMNLDVADAYRLLGMEGGKNFYCYNGQTPLTSAMLGVKYLYSDNILGEDPLRTLVDASGETYLYKNHYTLPGGFMLDADFEEKWNPQSGAWISNLNRLARLLGADEDMLTLYKKGEPLAGACTVEVEDDVYLYGIYEEREVSNITERVGEWERSFAKCTHGYLMDLGWREAGDEISFSSTEKGDLTITTYALNLSAVKQAYATLNDDTFSLTSKEDDRVEGTIRAEKAGNLILAIPSDEGWSVTVDGKETESGKFLGAFLSVPLEAGEHTIVLSYETPLFYEGLTVSLICAAILVLLMVVRSCSLKQGIQNKR